MVSVNMRTNAESRTCPDCETKGHEVEPSQRRDSPGIEAWRPAALQLSSVLLGLVIHTFWPVEIPLAARFGRIAIVLFLGLGLSIIAYCLSGFLLSAHIRMKREVKELTTRLDAIEGAAPNANRD